MRPDRLVALASVLRALGLDGGLESVADPDLTRPTLYDLIERHHIDASSFGRGGTGTAELESGESATTEPQP